MRWGAAPVLLRLLSLSAGLAGCAAPIETASPDNSPPIPFACPAPGTVARYDTGAILTFGPQAGFNCPYIDGLGRSGIKVAGFADDGRLLDLGLTRLWPLHVGGAQCFNAVLRFPFASAGYVTVQERYSVLRRETLTVPAGTFDTVVVEWEEFSNTDGGIYDGKRLFWYAPALGLSVKSTITILASASPRIGRMTFLGSSPVIGDYEAVGITKP